MTSSERFAWWILAIPVVVLSLHGMGRSLWIDEAWVANSVIAPQLKEVFYYPDWLQTTPPLFLLLNRWMVSLLGLSNFSLRLVPLLLSWIGWAALTRLLLVRFGPRMAFWGSAMVALQVGSLEYSHTLKQYGAEATAATLVLWACQRYVDAPSRRGLAALGLALVGGIALAYSTLFLIPGVLWMAVRRDRRQGTGLGIVVALAAGIVLAVFLLQNYSPLLREFWRGFWDGSVPWIMAGSLLAISVAIRLPLGIATGVAVIVSALTGFYPATGRTFLFLYPLTAFALLGLLHRYLPKSALSDVWMLLGLVLIRPSLILSPDPTFEAGQAAVRYLAEHRAPADLLLVHPSMIEPFKLYNRMDHGKNIFATYGATGWPCCTRREDKPAVDSEAEVRTALDPLIPQGFSGRVWLLFTTRPPHWERVGGNQGEMWRKQLWERGCPPGGYQAFPNVAVALMDCQKSKSP